MHKGHFGSSGASVEYGNATGLFPVDELAAPVLQHRDAQLALDDVDAEDVIVIAPTSLATSYLLSRHALTAIPVESLPPAVHRQLAEQVTAPLESFELIQIGRWRADTPNHSLSEFTNA